MIIRESSIFFLQQGRELLALCGFWSLGSCFNSCRQFFWWIWAQSQEM